MTAEIVIMVACGAAVGLFSVKFDLEQGKFSLQDSYNYSKLSYLSQTTPNFVYAISEGLDPESLIKLQVSSNSLNRANQSSSINLLKTGAAYLSSRSITNTSTRLAVAHYGSGNIEFADDSGTTLSNGPTYKFTYFSNVTSRQEAPHPHCIIPYDNMTTTDYFVTDLGADRFYLVHLDESAKTISITNYTSLDPGSGPRHILRHPKFIELIFVLTELSNSLLVYKETSPTIFTLEQKYSTLINSSSDNIDKNTTYQTGGHLGISDDGQYIIASNRGHVNSIVVFGVENSTRGTLKSVSVNGSGGFHPRFFLTHGNYLIVANRFSNNLVAFKFENGTIGAKVDEIFLQDPIAMQVVAKIDKQTPTTNLGTAPNCNNNDIGIGLNTNITGLRAMLGWDYLSTGYHGDDGKLYYSDSHRGKIYGPKYSTGDIVGCMARRGVRPDHALYPVIGFGAIGGCVRVNFGDESFVYDIKSDIEKLKKS
uniref:Uncharacterized protein n=1 Tax=Acrobeloides nanus TaxID=290746 RepID=A0A914DPF9_9BILA